MERWMRCPHGKRLDECEECFDWLRRFEQARRAGDARALEGLNQEAKSWHHEHGQGTQLG
jgi:hypothetical protein